MKLRIYADTSVISGCLDEEFAEASRRLLDKFKAGEAIIVVSELTMLELGLAPVEVQAVLDGVPVDQREYVELTEVALLAQLYF